ncbi:MAG: hypothetical protein MJ252_19035 [archaeon]|nr:hypothetical protein [archaeon]
MSNINQDNTDISSNLIAKSEDMTKRIYTKKLVDSNYNFISSKEITKYQKEINFTTEDREIPFKTSGPINAGDKSTITEIKDKNESEDDINLFSISQSFDLVKKADSDVFDCQNDNKDRYSKEKEDDDLNDDPFAGIMRDSQRSDYRREGCGCESGERYKNCGEDDMVNFCMTIQTKNNSLLNQGKKERESEAFNERNSKMTSEVNDSLFSLSVSMDKEANKDKVEIESKAESRTERQEKIESDDIPRKIEKKMDLPSKNKIQNKAGTTTKSKEIKKSEEITNEPLFNFLASIHLEKYYDNLNSNGFEDINLIINQTKKGMGITDSNLRDSGISFPGDRAKILIKLQDEAHNFKFDIPKSVYYTCSDPRDYKTDRSILKLRKWLESMKLGQFLKNFVENGYHSLELLIVQMLSKQPLTYDILQYEIGIEKLGWRARILNQLEEESKAITNKFKSNTLLIDNLSANIPCKCCIY